MQSYKKILRQLIRESINLLFEGADYISFAGEEYNYGDEDAFPFFYYQDKLYIGRPRDTHWSIIDEQLSKRMGILIKRFKDTYGSLYYDTEKLENEAWDSARGQIMMHTMYNGRVWTESKVISFWRLPETEQQFIEVINDINSKADINIDGSWKIYTQDDNGQDNMIPLKDFTHGKLSPEAEKKNAEMWKQHLMSPLEKEKQGLKVIPQGWGSTHKDYAGHREIDRAIGRAQE